MLGTMLIAIVLMSNSAFTKSLHSPLFTPNVLFNPASLVKFLKITFSSPSLYCLSITIES